MFNEDNYAIMLGMSYATYEGIGAVLPIMEAADKNAKENFSLLIGLALATICLVHITFSEVTYYAYGDDITETIIINQMPQDNPVIIVGNILYIFVIVFSYPVTIFVTNYVIEYIIFRRMEHSTARKWLKNLSRTIVLALGVIIGTIFYYQLPKIAGIIGAIFGTIVVFIFPSILHNKLVAKTTCDRCFNIFLIVYGVVLSIVILTLLIINWNNGTSHH